MIFSGLICLLAGCAIFKSSGTNPTEFNVFFRSGSAALSQEAIAIIDMAAEAIRRERPRSVTVSVGRSSGDSLRLAEPRFRAVVEHLILRGVSGDLIVRAPLVERPAELGATADRRVEIRLARRP